MTRLRMARTARPRRTGSVTREAISMYVPVVVRSWPEERNTTELSVTFKAFSKRLPVNRFPVGWDCCTGR